MTTERNSFLYGIGIGCIMGGTCIAVMAIVCFLLSFLAGSSGLKLDLDRSDQTETPPPSATVNPRADPTVDARSPTAARRVARLADD
jgi:hypothetical protein